MTVKVHAMKIDADLVRGALSELGGHEVEAVFDSASKQHAKAALTKFAVSLVAKACAREHRPLRVGTMATATTKRDKVVVVRKPRADRRVPVKAAADERRLLQRITYNPAIFGGKPIVRGRRLAVEHVLEMLAVGDTEGEILAAHPWLEVVQEGPGGPGLVPGRFTFRCYQLGTIHFISSFATAGHGGRGTERGEDAVRCGSLEPRNPRGKPGGLPGPEHGNRPRPFLDGV